MFLDIGATIRDPEKIAGLCWRIALRAGFTLDSMELLTRISHHLTAEARDKAAIPSLRLLAVLTVLSSTPPPVERRAPRTDGLLTPFASPRGEKSGLIRLKAGRG